LNDYGSDRVKSGTYEGQAMFFKYMNGIYKKESGWIIKSGHEKYPVTGVTWFGSNEYSQWAGERLPSEAE
jgi:formylglycine-generating enzyme required for sulfatase activity